MRILTALIVILGLTGSAVAQTPTFRVGVLKFGTVNWLMDTISENALDTAEGYTLETVAFAGGAATKVALQADAVDSIVTDWVWAMREAEEGVDYAFLPYSRSLGAVMVRPEAGIATVCDLRGRKIGVVGGAIDKSWLVLQALVRDACGFDLAAESETLFGAPPLMSRQIETGDVDAISTYWHYAAKLEAAGLTRLIGVNEAMNRLGIAPEPPLIGFVWNSEAAARRSGIAEAFSRSVAAAGRLLATSDAEWDRLRPKMNAQSDAAFALLRDYWRAGIVTGWSDADTEGARKLHEALIGIGGDAYRKTSGPFVAKMFPAADG